MRGVVSALLALLQQSSSTAAGRKSRWSVINDLGENEREELVAEVIEIGKRLGKLGLQDVAPPDEEALAHAREHASIPSESNRNTDSGASSEVSTTLGMNNDHDGKLDAFDSETKQARKRHAEGIRELDEVRRAIEMVLAKVQLDSVLATGTPG